MLKILKQKLAKLVTYITKSIHINDQLAVNLIYVDLLRIGLSINICLVYEIRYNETVVGRINVIKGCDSKVISAYGNIGIDIEHDYRGKGIGKQIVKYFIKRILITQKCCKVMTKVSNSSMNKILSSSNYFDLYSKNDVNTYVYRR